MQGAVTQLILAGNCQSHYPLEKTVNQIEVSFHSLNPCRQLVNQSIQAEIQLSVISTCILSYDRWKDNCPSLAAISSLFLITSWLE